jgi:hypothetical protein
MRERLCLQGMAWGMFSTICAPPCGSRIYSSSIIRYCTLVPFRLCLFYLQLQLLSDNWQHTLAHQKYRFKKASGSIWIYPIGAKFKDLSSLQPKVIRARFCLKKIIRIDCKIGLENFLMFLLGSIFCNIWLLNHYFQYTRRYMTLFDFQRPQNV